MIANKINGFTTMITDYNITIIINTDRITRYGQFFFFKDPPTTEIYTLSLHDALPICGGAVDVVALQVLGAVDRLDRDHGRQRHHRAFRGSHVHPADVLRTRACAGLGLGLHPERASI